MRILVIRRFLSDFVVFVNSKRDMHILEHDKRFFSHACYKDKKNKFYGKEYRFQCASRHNKSAENWVKKILKKEDK